MLHSLAMPMFLDTLSADASQYFPSAWLWDMLPSEQCLDSLF